MNKKKKTAVVCLVLCLVAILSLSSLAWFTDTDEVENTLSFDTSFEVDLYETEDDGTTKHEVSGETLGRTYENILPGTTLHKDPTVVNKSTTQAQYIRVSVTVDNAATWTDILTSASMTDLSEIFTGFDTAKWTRYDAPTTDSNADTVTYVFYLNSTLAAGSEETLFTGVAIPDALTLEQAKQIGTTTITIKAEAIQSANLGTPTDTKAAFTTVGLS